MTDPTQGTVSEWAGAYITATPWTRPGFFSPIIVNDDDTVDISGTLVTPSYDPTSNTMSFDWVNIVNSGTATTAKGELTFFSGGLTGLITPRPQDKPLPCTGQLNTLLDHPPWPTPYRCLACSTPATHSHWQRSTAATSPFSPPVSSWQPPMKAAPHC